MIDIIIIFGCWAPKKQVQGDNVTRAYIFVQNWEYWVLYSQCSSLEYTINSYKLKKNYDKYLALPSMAFNALNLGQKCSLCCSLGCNFRARLQYDCGNPNKRKNLSVIHETFQLCPASGQPKEIQFQQKWVSFII